MFICGDEPTFKKEAAAVCEDFGFEVEDMGTAKAARAIEPLAMPWCIPGLRENRWRHVFKLLKPDAAPGAASLLGLLSGSEGAMSYTDPKFWTTWQGRVNRRPYFFGGLAASIITEGQKLVPEGFQLVMLPLLLGALYCAICLGIKRCHDRGRSGWFMLLNIVPIICLWPIVELVFFKGETGPNAYGPDPLQPDAPQPAPGGWTLPTA